MSAEAIVDGIAIKEFMCQKECVLIQSFHNYRHKEVTDMCWHRLDSDVFLPRRLLNALP